MPVYSKNKTGSQNLVTRLNGLFKYNTNFHLQVNKENFKVRISVDAWNGSGSHCQAAVSEHTNKNQYIHFSVNTDTDAWCEHTINILTMIETETLHVNRPQGENAYLAVPDFGKDFSKVRKYPEYKGWVHNSKLV